ncbi:MAG: plasmid pRiA4b ORF-3 family protein [Planctomycetota bacterium]
MATTQHAMQFKVSLVGMSPPIWRRIVVPEQYTFWDHKVQLECVRPVEKGEALPRCTGGRRACPPENSGGPVYFTQVALPALATPSHPEHEFTVRLLGDFDPAKFDPTAVVFDDPLARLDRVLR